jgi:hypothetical protein
MNNKIEKLVIALNKYPEEFYELGLTDLEKSINIDTLSNSEKISVIEEWLRNNPDINKFLCDELSEEERKLKPQNTDSESSAVENQYTPLIKILDNVSKLSTQPDKGI